MNNQFEFNFVNGLIPEGYIDTGLNYAKVGGPPDDWLDIIVLDLETGKEIPDVIEANVDSGVVINWLEGCGVKRMKPYGKIAICRRKDEQQMPLRDIRL